MARDVLIKLFQDGVCQTFTASDMPVVHSCRWEHSLHSMYDRKLIQMNIQCICMYLRRYFAPLCIKMQAMQPVLRLCIVYLKWCDKIFHVQSSSPFGFY